MNKSKWFFPLQTKAKMMMIDKYKILFCNFQIITKDIVFEEYFCKDKDDKVKIILCKLGKNTGVLLYEHIEEN